MTQSTDGFRPETLVAIEAVERALELARCRVGAEDITAKDARDVMTAKPRLVRAGALGGEALRLMNQVEPRVTCLFVVADEDVAKATPTKPVGIVHVHDCLRAGVA